MTDIMLDIETLGTRPNSIILQVGLAEFDRNTGEIKRELCINIDYASSKARGFQEDQKTIDWWNKQPQKIRDSLKTNPYTCSVAADIIHRFIYPTFDSFKTTKIWSHATFDFPLLNNFLTKTMGKYLNYTMARDLRTLVDLKNIDLTKFNWDSEKTHNALDDVHFQIKYGFTKCN